MLLVLLGLTGSALLAAIAFWMGFNTTGKFNSVDDVRAHFGTIPIATIAISQDHRAAIVETREGTLFVVRVLGDKTVKRQIARSDIRQIAPGHARISLQDVGFPPLDFWCPQSTLETMFLPTSIIKTQ
jgi:hypothetical protein